MRTTFLLAGLCMVLVACSDGRVDFQPTVVAVPAGEGSGEPHLAVTHDGDAVLSWLEPDGDGHALRFSTLRAETWSAPTTVARGDHWFVNWADFPSVVPLSDTFWAAHWLVRQPAGGYAYDVAVSVSSDGGATWGPPVIPHTDGTPTEHGFVSMFPWQGGAGVVWLDGRNMAGDEPGSGEGHGHGSGGMTLRAAILGPDGSRSSEAVVDELTCDCCQTDVALAASGPVLVYRDRSEEEIRDIYVARTGPDGWLEPVRVADDGWQIDGCPVNGPAVAAAGDTVVVAWFSGAAGQARVRFARSGDGGATFGDPVEVDPEGSLGRVGVVLLPDGEAVVSWLRPVGERDAAVSVRRVAAGGEVGPVRDVATTTGGRPAGFPQMVWAGDRLVLSWTEADDAGTRVRSAWVDPASL